MTLEDLCAGCFSDKSGLQQCPQCGFMKKSSGEVSLFLAPGTLLAGKYLIGSVLGQGGFGVTYLGWDTNLQIKLAVKEYFPQGLVSRFPGQSEVISYSGTEKNQFMFGLERFLYEAKTLARFEHHPNIVTVRDFFKENGTAYMIMSYVEGLTLKNYLAEAGGKIPFKKVLDIMMPVMDALKIVHADGIMHRDISPDNILIDTSGRVIVIDFGAARQDIGEKSSSLSVILKAGYAPEEQYRSKGEQGAWTDVYAVAATMYRALTGVPPPESIERLNVDSLVPPSQRDVLITIAQEQTLLKGLSVWAKDRYRNIGDFQNALVDEQAVVEKREKGENESPEKRGNKGLRFAVTMIALAIMGIGSLYFLVNYLNEEEQLVLEPSAQEDFIENEPDRELKPLTSDALFLEQPNGENVERYVVVDVDVLRLRSGPGTEHDILERLVLGTELKVVGQSEEWLKVIVADGDEGWVHGNYVIDLSELDLSNETSSFTIQPVGDSLVDAALFVEAVTSYHFIGFIMPEFDHPNEIDNDDIILIATLNHLIEERHVLSGKAVQEIARNIFGPDLKSLVHGDVFPYHWDSEKQSYNLLAFGPETYTESKVLYIAETESGLFIDSVIMVYVQGDLGDDYESHVHDELGNKIVTLVGDQHNDNTIDNYLYLFPLRRNVVVNMGDGTSYVKQSYLLND